MQNADRYKIINNQYSESKLILGSSAHRYIDTIHNISNMQFQTGMIRSMSSIIFVNQLTEYLLVS